MQSLHKSLYKILRMLCYSDLKKKSYSKSISAPNVRGDFHIHIAMQHVTLKKFFKPTHPPEVSKLCFVWHYEY